MKYRCDRPCKITSSELSKGGCKVNVHCQGSTHPVGRCGHLLVVFLLSPMSALLRRRKYKCGLGLRITVTVRATVAIRVQASTLKGQG